jgi:hypothetical protein
MQAYVTTTAPAQLQTLALATAVHRLATGRVHPQVIVTSARITITALAVSVTALLPRAAQETVSAIPMRPIVLPHAHATMAGLEISAKRLLVSASWPMILRCALVVACAHPITHVHAACTQATRASITTASAFAMTLLLCAPVVMVNVFPPTTVPAIPATQAILVSSPFVSV